MQQVAVFFYGRLFALDLSTTPLFVRTDMAEQGAKLMATLGIVVGTLGGSDIIVPATKALARKHVGWKVTAP